MSRDEWGEALRAPAKHSGMLFPPLDQNTTSHLPAPSVSEDTLISLSLSLAAHIAAHGPKLASERKVVGIEIESYSDRFRDPAQPSQSADLDPAALRLDRAMFPPALWKAHFEAQPARRKGQAKDERVRKRVKLELDAVGDGDKPDDDQKSSSDSSVDDDFNFEDESDHQDYDANYFDNGEGDDDSGGEEDEGNGGGYDD